MIDERAFCKASVISRIGDMKAVEHNIWQIYMLGKKMENTFMVKIKGRFEARIVLSPSPIVPKLHEYL